MTVIAGAKKETVRTPKDPNRYFVSGHFVGESLNVAIGVLRLAKEMTSMTPATS